MKFKITRPILDQKHVKINYLPKRLNIHRWRTIETEVIQIFFKINVSILKLFKIFS